jgi:hypothetical protein
MAMIYDPRFGYADTDLQDVSVTYTAAGKINTETFVISGVTFVRTYRYDGSNRYIGQSGWVEQ